MIDYSFIKISVIYAEGKVTNISSNVKTEGGRIFLKGDGFGLIPHQATVEVVGNTRDGVVFMEGKITLSTESQLNMDVIRIRSKEERRYYLKVRVYMPARVLRAFSLGKRKKPFEINESVHIRDLSLGGIAFYSNRTFLKKQQLEIDLNSLKPGFTALAEILRKEKGPFRGRYRFKYGCRLLNISGEEERVLCEFVFRTQLENRNKLLRNGG